MITHIVNATNVYGYGKQLEAMHLQRHEVFVDKLGWSEIRDESGLDIDEFDHEDARYLLLCHDNGDVIGSCRLTPTASKNVTYDLLADYFEGRIERQDDVWEISRWLPSQTINKNYRTYNKMMLLSLFEFGLKNGIKSFVACADQRVIMSLASFADIFDEMGPPKGYEQGIAVTVKINVSAAKLHSLRKKFKFFDDATVELTVTNSPKTQMDNLHFSIIDTISQIYDQNTLSKILLDVSKHSLMASGVSEEDAAQHLYFQ